jgi:hypothetical protein
VGFFSYLVMNYGDKVLGHFSSVRPVYSILKLQPEHFSVSDMLLFNTGNSR